MAWGPTDPVETVNLKEHLAAIREALDAGRRPEAGGLLGLPALEDDVWVDTAGAAAVVGVPPKTITCWLSRGRPASMPFPAAHRYMYRLYWPLSQIEAWARFYSGSENSGRRAAALKTK
jgi:hypothetical protein